MMRAMINRRSVIIDCQVLLILTIYLFITLSNNYFLANITSISRYSCQITRLNGKATTDFIKRADKAICKQGKKNILLVQSIFHPGSFFEDVLIFYQRAQLLSGRSFPIQHYYYLLFLVLRI